MDVVDLEEIGEGGSVSRVRRACKRREGDHGQQKAKRRSGGTVRIIWEV